VHSSWGSSELHDEEDSIGGIITSVVLTTVTVSTKVVVTGTVIQTVSGMPTSSHEPEMWIDISDSAGSFQASARASMSELSYPVRK
jgi:hypothetical protein